MYKKYLDITKNYIGSFVKGQNGLSLLELAVGIVVIGLIATPLLHTYQTDAVKDRKAKNRGTLANAQSAINQYYANGAGAYPCPASLVTQEGDADFGMSVDCSPANLVNIELCTAAWQTNGGICKTDGSADPVIIGWVPVDTLHMSPEEGLGSWNNRIIYAVSFQKANAATFKGSAGVISAYAVDNPEDIVNAIADGIPDISAADTEIDFFLFSTGENGVGGFTKDGLALAPCPAVGGFPAAESYENENCDFDSVFFHEKDPADNRAFATSSAPGPAFFDDTTRAQNSVPRGLWFQHPDNNTYGGEEYVLTASSRMAVGKTFPDEAIDVAGSIRVQGDGVNTFGRVKSDALCDYNGSNCVDPELLTGQVDEMECDPASDIMFGFQPVMRVANSRVDCASTIYGETDENGLPVPNPGDPIDGLPHHVDLTVIKGNQAAGSDGKCAPGELVIGFEADGEIKCIVP